MRSIDTCDDLLTSSHGRSHVQYRTVGGKLFERRAFVACASIRCMHHVTGVYIVIRLASQLEFSPKKSPEYTAAETKRPKQALRDYEKARLIYRVRTCIYAFMGWPAGWKKTFLVT